MARKIEIIVEKHTDKFAGYPVFLKGVVVGEGYSYEEPLAGVKSAIRYYIQTFGRDVPDIEFPLLEVFGAEAGIEEQMARFPRDAPKRCVLKALKVRAFTSCVRATHCPRRA